MDNWGDDELCFDEQGVPLCPAEGDYEELIFCCVKKNRAFCCSEVEKLSYFTSINYSMIGVICLGLVLLLLVMGLGLFFILRRRFRSSTVTEPGMTDYKVNCSVPEFPMEEINLEQ